MANKMHNRWNDYYVSGKDFRPIPPSLLEEAIGTESLSGTKALDFGCGTGSNCATLANLGCEVTGVDQSTVAIERARDAYRGIHFIVGSVEKLQNKQTYNLILVSLVYRFIEDKQTFLRRLYDCLKPEGKLILYNPIESTKPITVDPKKLQTDLGFAGFRQTKTIDITRYGTDVLELITAVK